MALRKTPKVKEITPAVEDKNKITDLIGGDTLDPQEEKILDWILNGIVVFVLGWLGLGILLSVGGLFHLWG